MARRFGPPPGASRTADPVSTARNIFAYVKERASVGYQESIVRRTALLCGLVLPGFAANFLTYFFCALLLPADQFGVLYVAFTISNVLYAGSNIVNAFLTRHLVRVGENNGREVVVPTMLRLERDIGFIGAIIGALLFVALLAVSKQIGVQSPILIILILFDVYTAYMCDLGRVLLQSLRKTVALGFYTSIWMFLRFGLCVAGILLFKTVWGALSGVVLSAAIVFAVFHVWISYANRGGANAAKVTLPLLSLLPAAAGFALVALASNLDVLLGYFVLGESELGVYSASSVFPKAALVVIMPLLQMLIPSMIGADPSGHHFVSVTARIAGIILALTAAGSGVIWLLSNQLCGGRWGLKLCEPSILGILLISVVPQSLLRTLAIVEFARGRELSLFWLALPTAACALYLLASAPGITELASGFSIFSIVVFVFFAAVCLIAPVLRKRNWR